MTSPANRETGRCTCRSGRDYDGSEFGPCEACEAAYDRERARADVDRDAARWRISQVVYLRSMDDPFGYFVIEDDGEFHVGIQPHPITGATAINACILGEGRTEGDAIDSMFLALDGFADEGHQLRPEIEGPRSLAAESRP